VLPLLPLVPLLPPGFFPEPVPFAAPEDPPALPVAGRHFGRFPQFD
jgi:hypothetical protein